MGDARQSVLFGLGGFIAIVGLYFTYRRWMLEDQNTKVTTRDGELAQERHLREGDQLEVTRITDALTLLESEDRTKRVAALSLLGDYAKHAPEERHARLILDVLTDYIRDQDRNGYRRDEQGRAGDERLPIDELSALATRTLLDASVHRKLIVDLSGLTFVDLLGTETNWTYALLNGTAFGRCTLDGAVFGPSEQPMRFVKFQNTDLSAASFRERRLEGITFVDEDPAVHHRIMMMRHSNFSHTQLHNVTFGKVMLAGSSFAHAELVDVSFPESRVGLNDFTGARLSHVDFTDARFRRGELDLRGATLEEEVTGPEGIRGLSHEPDGPTSPGPDSEKVAPNLNSGIRPV